MSGDVSECTIARWDSKEIVAVVEGRAPCRLRQVLKIDRVGKRVTWMIFLSEPLSADVPKSLQDMCRAGEMSLERKDGQTWLLR
jgi:hypothetical protein